MACLSVCRQHLGYTVSRFCISQRLDVPADIIEHVDPIFYGDPRTAAMKALGLT